MKQNSNEYYTHIETTSFSASEKDIRFLRDLVFGREQKVPRELDWDGEDTGCTHVLVKDDSGRLARQSLGAGGYARPY